MVSKVIPTPAAAPKERQIKVRLAEFGHFDCKVLYWQAAEAGIKPKGWLAYRLTGHEYHKGTFGAHPVLVFAVLPVATPENVPEGWACTDGN